MSAVAASRAAPSVNADTPANTTSESGIHAAEPAPAVPASAEAPGLPTSDHALNAFAVRTEYWFAVSEKSDTKPASWAITGRSATETGASAGRSYGSVTTAA